MRLWRIIVLLAVLASACTLSNVRPTPAHTATDIAQDTTVTPTRTPTATPTLTRTPTPTSTRQPAVTLPPNCLVRTDWPVYTVRAGDTLASIARDASSTVNELATGNCLNNPNLITPGQQLRVPRLPAPPPPPEQHLGSVSVNPFLQAEGGAFTVRANTPITLRWPEARRDASRVEFYAALINNSASMTLIGTDTYPLDGASVNTSFPENYQRSLRAVAYLPGGSRQLTATNPLLFSIAPDPPPPIRIEGDIIISPVLRNDGDIRVVETGRTVILTWQGAPTNEGTQFEFTLDQGGVVGPRSIGIDNNGGDGVSVPWTVPGGLRDVRIFASTRLPGQDSVGIESRRVRVSSEDVSPSPQGELIISPLVREEGGWLVLPAQEQVTITWTSAPADGVQRVEFYLSPTGTGSTPQVIGSDNDVSDGVSIVWTVPPPFSGHLTARAFVNNGRVIEPANNMLNLTSE